MKEMKYQEIASKWRMQHPDHIDGVVLIWQGEAYGWKDKLRNPEHEMPGAIAINADGNLFIAEGGDDYSGAKCWVAFSSK